MNDTGTIAAIGTLIVLVLGAVGLLVSRQMKAVSGLLKAARGDDQGDDGQVVRTGRHQALPMMSCSPDCRADVLQAVKELREEVRTLADEMRSVIGKHRVRLALLEREVSGHNRMRRETDEADSDRPGR